jgi:predicted acylesterase/phospholipase RssA
MKHWLFLIVSICLSAPAWAEKPFKLALVHGGGGLNWPLFMGVEQALKDRGEEPDVAVGICGGSIAAAYGSLGIRNWRTEAYELSKEISFAHRSAYPLIPYLLSQGQAIKEKRLPDFAKYRIFEGLQAALDGSSLNIPFSRLRRPTIIVATRLLYDPYNIPQERVRELVPSGTSRGGMSYEWRNRNIRWEGRELYQLVFFTDPATARKLGGNMIPFAKELFPDAPFAPRIQVRTDATVAEAVRASISDPILFEPAYVRGNYYLTGATENQPVRILKKLSERTIDSVRGPLTNGEDTVFRSVFGYSSNETLKVNRAGRGQVLLALRYSTDLPKEKLMTPAFNKLLFWKKAVPATLEAYLEKLSGLEAFGYERASAGLRGF